MILSNNPSYIKDLLIYSIIPDLVVGMLSGTDPVIQFPKT